MNKNTIIIIISLLVFSASCFNCFAQQEMDQQEIVKVVSDQLQEISSVRVDFAQTYTGPDLRIELKGYFSFKFPDKFRSSYEIANSKMPFLTTENLLVYDGEVFWQQENMHNKLSSSDGNPKVMKSRFKSDSLQAGELLIQYSLKRQFEGYLKEYNVINAVLKVNDDHDYYVIYFELKKGSRQKKINTLKAKAVEDPELQIMENVIFTWDAEKKFVKKIEAYSKDKVYKSIFEYDNVSVNPELKDDFFKYKVPKGAEVIDITELMKMERNEQEYQGTENKMVGTIFPKFTFQSIFDDQYSSKDFSGKILIVNFWENWSQPCLQQLPEIEKLYQQVYTEDNVKLITITTDKEKALEIVEENGYLFPVLVDSEAALAEKLDVKSIPRTFIVGKDGLIKSVYIGGHNDIQALIEQRIKELDPEE